MSGESALSFLLEKLTDVIVHYANLKIGAKNELNGLKSDLDLLDSYLKDSAKNCGKSELLRAKERQIRELVYEVEDTIEMCTTLTAAAAKNIFRRAWIKISPTIEQKLRFLREQRVTPALSRMGVYMSPSTSTANGSTGNLEQPPTQVMQDQPTWNPSSAEDQSDNQNNSVYLKVKEQGTIVEYLMKSSNKLDVISMTGMAGLGKTTLARMIFEHPNVMAKFPLRIWISTQKFNKREVLLEILAKLDHKDTSGLTDELLSRVVCGCLANDKFLLVVDDVRNVETWDVIREILPKTNSTGKVLVISCEAIVAAPNDYVNMIPQQLAPLTRERSWELMKLVVFGDGQNCPQELEEIGQDIAKRCGGLPLICVMIGKILKDQIPPLPEEWLKFKVDNILEPDMEESIPSSTVLSFYREIPGPEKPKNAEIPDVVELVYNKLADDLRVCFLYTGLFPQGHEIPASTLTQLWIAESFIHPENGKSFEETARKYLNDLINQKLLMAKEMRFGQVKTCLVHDKVRQFCEAKAMEENLFIVITPPVHQVQNLYRLCFHSDPSDFLSGDQKPPHVRSFLCMLKKQFPLKKDTLAIPNAYKPLRVLNCKSAEFKAFPNVTRLILLKHITLYVENLSSLSKKISQLINLQTLVVDTNSRSIKVKANIWKMLNLMHLKTKAAFILEDKRKGTAKHLQTISRLSPESCSPDLSEKAPYLKTLGIRGELSLERLESLSLVKFTHLEKLKLEVDMVDGAASKSSLVSLPISFPAQLKRLILSKTYLSWSHMTQLAKIKTLEVLKLKDDAFTGPSWRAVDIFISLQFLLIENMDLVILEASTEKFPKLKCLEIKQCKNLKKLPESLAKLLEK